MKKDFSSACGWLAWRWAAAAGVAGRRSCGDPSEVQQTKALDSCVTMGDGDGDDAGRSHHGPINDMGFLYHLKVSRSAR